MKRKFILNAVLIILSGITMSCSTNLDMDGEKVKSTFLKSRGIKAEFVNFSEIKLVRDVTVEDSINYFLKFTDDISKDYDATLQGINRWIELKKKEANSYSEWDHDHYIQKFTNELNMFSDAYEGKFSDENWKHYYVYSKLYRLRKMTLTKVIGKIYSITYTSTASKETRTQLWLFDADITTTIGGVLSNEDLKVPEHRDIEKIHFERYKEAQKEENVPEAEVIQKGGDIQE